MLNLHQSPLPARHVGGCRGLLFVRRPYLLRPARHQSIRRTKPESGWSTSARCIAVPFPWSAFWPTVTGCCSGSGISMPMPTPAGALQSHRRRCWRSIAGGWFCPQGRPTALTARPSLPPACAGTTPDKACSCVVPASGVMQNAPGTGPISGPGPNWFWSPRRPSPAGAHPRSNGSRTARS